VADTGVTAGPVVGLGTDLVDVDRFRRAWARRGDRLVERLFSDAEREYAQSHRDPVPRLAARFAAKEAVMKALGVGLGDLAFRDVEVVRAESGAPGLVLSGRAAALASAQDVRRWQLSLSHTDTTAIAVALALA
jgi:holo-[acyl-carrier protein] synthase